MVTGQCECGAVKFETATVRPEVTFCHCSQCRRLSGHLWASTHVPFSAVTFTNDAGLAWYASSGWAERGFCNTCGSTLFYRLTGKDDLGIAAGCLDDDAGLKPGKHIFVADKGNYYEIAGDAPQLDTH
ncbi:GFA family protein [Loktanella sp. F6476L]|uniref:GFA family protein n=1 Tax=Loktanella sp. F6476L TaxID=2926405 RepID=UPI001FF3F561|nr:GFA family protein [Loktanella sp. F6476L]MCK0121916.1 GFA family protein [Loktanella sp. F6476L]